MLETRSDQENLKTLRVIKEKLDTNTQVFILANFTYILLLINRYESIYKYLWGKYVDFKS